MLQDVIRFSALGLAAVFCSLLLKRDNPASALLLTAALGMVILAAAMDMLRSLRDFFSELAEYAEISEGILSPLMKTLGISLVTRLTADAARDAKETAAASYIELGGTITALYAALPLMRTLVQLLRSLCAL